MSEEIDVFVYQTTGRRPQCQMRCPTSYRLAGARCKNQAVLKLGKLKVCRKHAGVILVAELISGRIAIINKLLDNSVLVNQ